MARYNYNSVFSNLLYGALALFVGVAVLIRFQTPWYAPLIGGLMVLLGIAVVVIGVRRYRRLRSGG